MTVTKKNIDLYKTKKKQNKKCNREKTLSKRNIQKRKTCEDLLLSSIIF